MHVKKYPPQPTRAGVRAKVEQMESRWLLAAQVTPTPIPSLLAHISSPTLDTIPDLSNFFTNPDIPGTIAQFTVSAVTGRATFDVALTDNATPQTVENFTTRADAGYYNGTFFHRSAVFGSPETGGSESKPADIIQAGGFSFTNGIQELLPGNTVPNEVSTATLQNVSGTIAMAKSAAGPDSATGQFFFNVHDNPALDDPLNNGGFTAFGKVLAPGMANVIEPIAAFPTADLTRGDPNSNLSAFTELPVAGLTPEQAADPATNITGNNLVYITKVTTFWGMTFTATSSQPRLLRPIIDGRSLSFQYARHSVGGVVTVTVIGKSFDGTSISSSFLVTVPNPNTPFAGPVANDDSPPNVPVGQTAYLTPLDNDTDSQGRLEPSSISIFAGPSHGSATLDPRFGTIIYTPVAGYVGPDSFQYTVGNANETVSAAATVNISVVNPATTVTIGTSARKSLNYTDPDGTKARIIIVGGSAVITFAGTDVLINTVRGVVTVTGTDATVADINITDLTPRGSTLLVTATGGDGMVRLGSISDQHLAAFFAPSATLTGHFAAVQLGRMVIGGTDGITMNFGPFDAEFVSIGKAIDTSIESQGGLKLLRSGAWLSNTGFDYSITATKIGSMMISGDCAESVILTGGSPQDLRAAFIRGRLTQGSWYIRGPVGAVAASSVDSSWSLTSQDLVRVLHFGGDFGGAISVGAIGTMIVKGSMNGASLYTLAPISPRNPGFVQLGALLVGGNIVDSRIRGNGNLGVLVGRALINSEIFAGLGDEVVDAHALPTDATGLSASASLQLVRVRSFSNSRIVASKVGNVSIGTITTQANGVIEGVAGRVVGSITGVLDTGARLFLTRIQTRTQAALNDYLSKKSITLQDFKVVILT